MASESIKNCSLHKLVQERRKEVAGRIGFKKWLKRRWALLCIPSWRSGLAAAGLIVAGFFIIDCLAGIIDCLAGFIPYCVSCWFSFIPEFINSHHEHYQNPISILTGIGTIIFALVIFVAETFKDKPATGPMLLKQSFIWLLIIWVICSFFLVLFGKNNGTIFLLLAAVSFSVLCSLYNVISVLLNRNEFLKKYQEFLDDVTCLRIRDRIDIQLASNILSSHLRDSKIPLSFTHYALVRGKEYIFIQASKTGRITDINLCKLEKFAQFLEGEAQKNNYSYTDTPPSGAEESKHTGSFKQRLSKISAFLWAKIGRNPTPITSSQTLRPTKNRHRYLLKQYGDRVSADDRFLLCYDRQLIAHNPQAQRNLEEIAKAIFTIKPVKRGAE